MYKGTYLFIPNPFIILTVYLILVNSLADTEYCLLTLCMLECWSKTG